MQWLVSEQNPDIEGFVRVLGIRFWKGLLMQDSDSFVARSHMPTGQHFAEVVKALLFSC
jgi:hypothetical protein